MSRTFRVVQELKEDEKKALERVENSPLDKVLKEHEDASNKSDKRTTSR